MRDWWVAGLLLLSLIWWIEGADVLSTLLILGHLESSLTPLRPSQLGEAVSKPIALEYLQLLA